MQHKVKQIKTFELLHTWLVRIVRLLMHITLLHCKTLPRFFILTSFWTAGPSTSPRPSVPGVRRIGTTYCFSTWLPTPHQGYDHKTSSTTGLSRLPPRKPSAITKSRCSDVQEAVVCSHKHSLLQYTCHAHTCCVCRRAWQGCKQSWSAPTCAHPDVGYPQEMHRS